MMRGTNKPLRETNRPHAEEQAFIGREANAVGNPGGRQYQEVLIALNRTPATAEQIAERIRAAGQSVRASTIHRHLNRAVERGAAIKTKGGWREPDDALTEGESDAAKV